MNFKKIKFINNHKLLIILLSIIYFILIGFINSRGAYDLAMLNMFRNDESNIYNTSSGLLRGNGFSESFRYFINPEFKMYGYIYHFLNAIALIISSPFKAVSSLSALQFDVFILRQLNVIYFLSAIWMLIECIFNKASSIEKILGWVFIVTIPGAFMNNVWIHTDNLGLLLIVSTIYMLSKDNNNFGFNFYLSGLLWGLSINTKFVGLFLFPMFFYYIFFNGNINLYGFKKLILNFFKLLLIVIGSYLITSPFLFINHNAIRILDEILQYSKSYVSGSINVPTQFKPLFWYQEVISTYFFKWYFIFPIIIGFFAAYRREKNSTQLIVLGCIPLTIHLLINVGWVGFWYLIPCLVPIIAISSFFIDKKIKYYIYINLFSFLIIIFQLSNNIFLDKKLIISEYNRVENSQFLQFYKKISEFLYDNKINPRYIYLDSSTYYPSAPPYEITKKWGFATYEDIEAKNFDLIVFQRNYIDTCSDINNLKKYTDYTKESIESFMPCHFFYNDVRNNSIRNFKLLYENEFASAFIRK